MNDAVIVSGARTPVGRFGGAFKDVSAPDLGAIAIKAAIERAGISPDMVDEVVLGNAIQAAEAGYAARLASLKSGIPHETPTIAVNRQCSSGLEAINMAAQLVRTGEAEIVVAGGTENMSQVPFLIEYRARFDGLRMGNSQLVDGLTEGLGCPVNRYHMGVTAENVAERFSVSRSDQDELALISHHRASSAITQGRFSDQITEVSVPQRRGDAVIVTEDEGPRADTTIEGLANLRPVFKKDGTVTAGNASSINDGSAAIVMMSATKAADLGLKPRMKWHTRGIAGVEPAVMGTGPVPAVEKAMKKSGMSVDDIDVIELNEAFASQALYCIRELDLDIDRTNINGSGISLGHPVGATGAIMTVKLMEEMERSDSSTGLVTMCVGGGQGVATIFERLN
ncbi:MAG: acetyl-CoA C-acetyltransferase [SAR202 cluster bacterium]|jgi:acetyl-CoA C-acetyltransferase|nr:MAG: acetyl-CoA C-acetyltransferase [SAR202 cluster bacterium]MAR86184.1 acetyl-CoA C-acyltransferase [Chloroflexota bacterium]|tara:strand:- start:117 stop:1304 length:1188 start_codon:yes stop_codon:yes gene_type:complete